MKRSQPAKPVSDAVNHDVATRAHTKFARTLAVRFVGIREMKRKMKPAVLLPPVNLIDTLGRLVVAFPLFRREPTSPERNGVGSNDVVAIEQQKFVFSLQDNHSLDFLLCSWESREQS